MSTLWCLLLLGLSLEFGDPSDLTGTRINVIGKNGAAAPSSDIADVRIEDGVLRLGAKFGDTSLNDQYVTVAWGNDSGHQGGQASGSFAPVPIVDKPFIEFRWRRPAEEDELVVQANVIWLLRRKDGSLMTGYSTAPCRVSPSWRTETARFAPDSAIPGPMTPTEVVGIRLELGAQTTRRPTAVEFDYIRIRAASEDDQRIEQERIAPLRNYVAPPLPARLRDKFVYGVFHTAPYIGGWEGQFDELVRMHVNSMHGPGAWHADILHVAKSAGRAGIMIFPWPTASIAQYEGTWATAGPEQTRKTAMQLVEQTRDLDAIAGWFIADEPAVHKLIGVAGVKSILDQLDPQRVGIFVHFSTDRAKYFDRFTTVMMTDHYPLKGGKRDPWDVAPWCRQISEFTDKPHWFIPQAFGSQANWKSSERTKTYLGPTPAEFRLMMNLALANGVKGFFLFNYNHVEWSALADPVGNLTPLGEEAKRIGARFHEVAPLLLDARPVYDPVVTVKCDGRFNVTALGDAVNGPLFLVAVNEDIEKDQEAHVELPAVWRSDVRSVYSLESLTKVGTISFPVEPLKPGGGRVYLLGTPQQFGAVRLQLLHNRVNERLRVQGADRLIAVNWGLTAQIDSAYVPLAEAARANVESSDAYDLAAAKLEQTITEQTELTACRAALSAVKAALGRANLAIYLGAKRPRPGREAIVEPFEQLCRDYSDVRRKYLLGHRGGWMDFREGRKQLVTDVKQLQIEAAALLVQAEVK